MQVSYISAADTAKLIRSALKKAFPAVKFSVRSKSYSGGASIDVAWTDGPADCAVSAITGQFAGGRFDGMIDLKTSVRHWLLPDGSAVVASDEGTRGSGGVLPAERNWMPHPEAKLVSFCADFVFTSRAISPALMRRVLNRLAERGYPVETVEMHEAGSGSAYVRQIDYSPERARGFDMEREVHRAAVRTHCIA